MVAYNFQARFATAVADGSKRQTIRAERKDGRHAKPGDRIQLYTGMRTRACRKLRDPDPICSESRPIQIASWCVSMRDPDPKKQLLLFVPDHLDAFARADGFADFEAMKTWFAKTHGLPFSGRLIGWEPEGGEASP